MRRIRACADCSRPGSSRETGGWQSAPRPGGRRSGIPNDSVDPLLASHSAEFAASLGQHIVLVAVVHVRRRGHRCAAGNLRRAPPARGRSARRDRQHRPDRSEPGDVRVPAAVPLLGGVGARAALVVLILYGCCRSSEPLSPGINGIDRAIREAGVAMGMTPRELLRQVELPLALPSIVAGIRVAAVVGVGSATIAAAIGAGGLGEYIYRGLSMVDTTVILAGAIPAALLALIVDGGSVARSASSRRAAGSGSRGGRAASPRDAAVAARGRRARQPRDRGVIVVGSKNFTEQVILGELWRRRSSATPA